MKEVHDEKLNHKPNKLGIILIKRWKIIKRNK